MTLAAAAPATPGVWVWAPPESADRALADDWALLGLALAEQGKPVPSVTTSELARGWGRDAYRIVFVDRVEDLAADHPYAEVWDAVLTVQAGVAPDDLYRVGQAVAEVHGIKDANRPRGAASNLRTTVQARFGQHTLRSVVGWLLAEQAIARDGGLADHEHVRDYVRVGLEEDGWLYAAAGLSAAEAVAARASGDLEVERWRMMAALRGAHLPVG